MKVAKIALVSTAVLLLTTIGVSSYASETPAQKGLNDFKRMEQNKINKQKKAKGNQNNNNTSPLENLKLMDDSITIYNLGDKEDQLQHLNQDKPLSKLLKHTDEKISFMANGKQVEGIIVADSKEPIGMWAGEACSDFYDLYQLAMREKDSGSTLTYLDFDGSLSRLGGMFISMDKSGEESVWLGETLADLFSLQKNQKLPATLVKEKMTETIKEMMDLQKKHPDKVLFGTSTDSEPIFKTE